MAAPAGTRIYAIGDIHGRADLLADMKDKIASDMASANALHKVVVFLGDYIDRGVNSRGVIDMLTAWDVGDEIHCLRGNHEQMLMSVLQDATQLPAWRRFGGLETLQSYGLPAADIQRDEMLGELRDGLAAAMPTAHLTFLQNLPLYFEAGDYFFCHAGIDPRVPLDRQTEEALLWIREDFLYSTVMFDKCIVHGHSPSGGPDEQPNRLGLDTGAYASGILTCAVLEGQERRYLSASAKVLSDARRRDGAGPAS